MNMSHYIKNIKLKFNKKNHNEILVLINMYIHNILYLEFFKESDSPPTINKRIHQQQEISIISIVPTTNTGILYLNTNEYKYSL